MFCVISVKSSREKKDGKFIKEIQKCSLLFFSSFFPSGVFAPIGVLTVTKYSYCYVQTSAIGAVVNWLSAWMYTSVFDSLMDGLTEWLSVLIVIVMSRLLTVVHLWTDWLLCNRWMDWLTNRLTDWMTDWWMDGLADRLTDWWTYWPEMYIVIIVSRLQIFGLAVNCLPDWLTDWWMDGLTDWLTDW